MLIVWCATLLGDVALAHESDIWLCARKIIMCSEAFNLAMVVAATWTVWANQITHALKWQKRAPHHVRVTSAVQLDLPVNNLYFLGLFLSHNFSLIHCISGRCCTCAWICTYKCVERRFSSRKYIPAKAVITTWIVQHVCTKIIERSSCERDRCGQSCERDACNTRVQPTRIPIGKIRWYVRKGLAYDEKYFSCWSDITVCEWCSTCAWVHIYRYGLAAVTQTTQTPLDNSYTGLWAWRLQNRAYSHPHT